MDRNSEPYAWIAKFMIAISQNPAIGYDDENRIAFMTTLLSLCVVKTSS